MRIYLIFFILTFSLSVDARREMPVTGAEYLGGGPSGDINTEAGTTDGKTVDATESGAGEKVTPTDGTSQMSTYEKIRNRQVKMQTNPSPFDVSNIGTDMIPKYNFPMMMLNNLGKIGELFDFNADDFISFVALEPTEVNGVKGYLGTIRKNGNLVRDSSGNVRQFFVPNDQYKNMTQGYLLDAIKNPHSLNRRWNHDHTGKDCTDPYHNYYETPTEQRKLPRDKEGFLKGCEPLGREDMDERDQDMLFQCIKSIKAAISVQARNNAGALDSKAWKCNAFAQLNTEEEEFAALIFGAMAEGNIFLNSSRVQAPGYQELAFIMKVQKNRAEEVKRRISTNYRGLGDLKDRLNPKGDINQYNALDAVLSCGQFSAFNGPTPTSNCDMPNKFNGAKDFFEPNNSSLDTNTKKTIRAFLNIDKVKGKNVDKVLKYYAPYAMGSDGNSRKRTRLEAAGKVPKGLGLNVPNWEFDTERLSMATDLKYEGNSGIEIPVRKPVGNPSHVFYTSDAPQKVGIGVVENMIKDRAQCDIPNITDRALAQQAGEDINEGDNRMNITTGERYYGPQ